MTERKNGDIAAVGTLCLAFPCRIWVKDSYVCSFVQESSSPLPDSNFGAHTTTNCIKFFADLSIAQEAQESPSPLSVYYLGYT